MSYAMRKPVIAFLTSSWVNIDDRIRAGRAPGGVPSVARIWSECLKNGYEVHVFVATYLSLGGTKQSSHLGGVQFHWIDMPFPTAVRWMNKGKLTGAARLLAASKLLSVLWQVKMWARVRQSEAVPDIIYLMRPTFALVGRWWARRAHAKIVLRQYGTWVYHARAIEPSLASRFQTLGEYWAMKMPLDLFIMTNDGSMGDRAANLAGIPKAKLRFWMNGIDKSKRIAGFDRAAAKKALGLAEDAPVILTLGRLAFWKRIDRAIDAMPGILAALPQATLLVVGDGPMRRQWEEQALQLGVEGSILWLGAVPHGAVDSYLNTCDVFLIQHDLTNLCNTLLEAMASGCCVITRDVGDTSLVAHDGINAVVLDEDGPDRLSSIIVALLNDPLERDRLGRNAREWALQKLQTWDERMATEVSELNRLISRETLQ